MEDRRRIFISYAREDTSFCQQLYEALVESGFSVWMDTQSITIGHDWADSIAEAIRNSDALIAVHSTASLGRSYQVKGEWIHAYDLKKPIFPVIAEPGVGVYTYFEHLQAVDFSHPGTFRSQVQKLVQALKSPEPSRRSVRQFQIDLVGEPVLFPNFFNARTASYAKLIDAATEIRSMSTTGNRLLARHDGVLISRLSTGKCRLKLAIATPSEANLRVISAWSLPTDFEESYETLREDLREGARRVKKMARSIPTEALEIRLSEALPTYESTQFDPDADDGIILFSIYRMGLSIESQRMLRPGTMLTRDVFPELYEHFQLGFHSVWSRAEPISVQDYVNLWPG
ncbi:MAG TPA: toll/interleukin-1 receptor domain-containing protein [Aggregatilineales bacterium]|nr:toll/interleukin-1 receptor domain-containing protein [Aggregatilineales bacterium]